MRSTGLNERLRLLSSTENRGKGAALAAGAGAARGDLILLMDADGATEISCVGNYLTRKRELTSA